jgi:hypothetical protein
MSYCKKNAIYVNIKYTYIKLKTCKILILFFKRFLLNQFNLIKLYFSQFWTK